MPFQISPLRKITFNHLFSLPTEQLAEHQARRVIATKNPGFPCRVSLQDAEIGEEVLLTHYEHQPVDSPFRASHAVYVRPNAAEAVLELNQVPNQLRTRILSLRAFDKTGMMVEADLAEGTVLEPSLDRLLANPATVYVDIHFAKPGCYAATARRAS